MKRLALRVPSPALAVSVIALTVSLAGSAYAVTNLPAGSVGTKQLKPGAVKTRSLGKGSVTSAKVRDASLLAKDFKSGQLPAGPIGPRGERGAKGDIGEKGEQGAQGVPGPLLDTLPSGESLRGSFNGGNGSNVIGTLVEASISYPFPLAGNVDAHVIQPGAAAPPECPGTAANPQAQAGHLCVFVQNKLSVGSVGSYGTADGFTNYRFGAALAASSTAVTQVAEFWGTWAVTAP